jgi:repressor LexA
LDVDHVSRRVSGKSVSRVTLPDSGRLAIHFTDGSILLVERRRQGLATTLASGDPPGKGLAPGVQPTRRQREYLAFITRYILRFGVSPAESDIERHFLLSAPSVNHMIQTLERRGFITRQRGVPRSIRVVDHTGQRNVLQ